ncbi:MAG TPA: DinB family protein [Gemmatimonadaceae bacterium]|nr:DinB family protein [Gemmatimonadaceae bacterium]
MQRQLAALVDSLEAAQGKLRTLSDNVSDTQWNRHPATDAWSAADCVEHLNLTSRAYVPLLREAIASARLMKAPPARNYRMDLPGRFLAFMMRPMKHIGKFKIGRVKTTGPFTPRGGQPRDQLLSDFVRLQSDLISLTRSADGLPIDRVKIQSPFGNMRYNAYSALEIVAQHEHRHLQQAEEATR